jgi:hypothetical protein
MKRPSSRPMTMVRHTEMYRPWVETVEERLPPGDILLAEIRGASWFGANASEVKFARSNVPSAATPVRWSAPESHRPPVPVLQRQASEQTLNRNAQSLIARAPREP